MVPPKQRAEICFQVWLLGKQKSDSTSCRWGPGQCRNRERIQKFRKQVMEMETKSPKHTNKRHVLATTTRKPGDFSFGSPESRAIARSILQPANQLPLLSQEELDCLRLYSGESYLNVTTRPDCKDLERTPAYAHGKEIHLLLCGPTVPYHLNAKAKRSSLASISFGAAFGREPRAGDILRFEDVQRAAIGKRHSVENFIRAWKRQLPEMPCPLRVDGERIFCRVKRNQNSYLRPPPYRPMMVSTGQKPASLALKRNGVVLSCTLSMHTRKNMGLGSWGHCHTARQWSSWEWWMASIGAGRR